MTLSASELDGVVRRTWSSRVALVDPSAWIWLDETGSHPDHTSPHVQAPRSQRA